MTGVARTLKKGHASWMDGTYVSLRHLTTTFFHALYLSDVLGSAFYSTAPAWRTLSPRIQAPLPHHIQDRLSSIRLVGGMPTRSYHRCFLCAFGINLDFYDESYLFSSNQTPLSTCKLPAMVPVNILWAHCSLGSLRLSCLFLLVCLPAVACYILLPTKCALLLPLWYATHTLYAAIPLPVSEPHISQSHYMANLFLPIHCGGISLTCNLRIELSSGDADLFFPHMRTVQGGSLWCGVCGVVSARARENTLILPPT